MKVFNILVEIRKRNPNVVIPEYISILVMAIDRKFLEMEKEIAALKLVDFIDQSTLPTKLQNLLINAGFTRLSQLHRMNEQELLKLKYFGNEQLKELKEYLDKRGIQLVSQSTAMRDKK